MPPKPTTLPSPMRTGNGRAPPQPYNPPLLWSPLRAGRPFLEEARPTFTLNLHAQAIAVNNIRSLVHIVLDVDSNHFNRWRSQFLLVLSKFSLQAHVLAASAPSPGWDRMDCVVKSWILDSLTDDLAKIVSS
jgi:hypothetical protein